ncbi:MAG: copper chaperone PCu(A)C, partial [Woeseiaceae bacterium]
MKHTILILLLALLALACEREEKPAVAIENVRVFAPLPGRSASVAYLDVHNRGDSPITLASVSSPAFQRAEIHETRLTDGVASMQLLETLEIAGRSQFNLAPGGAHIMLLDPRQALLPGANVQLELLFGDGSV